MHLCRRSASVASSIWLRSSSSEAAPLVHLVEHLLVRAHNKLDAVIEWLEVLVRHDARNLVDWAYQCQVPSRWFQR